MRWIRGRQDDVSGGLGSREGQMLRGREVRDGKLISGIPHVDGSFNYSRSSAGTYKDSF
jgi:hypothetical protein